jgi:hypothetical protein
LREAAKQATALAGDRTDIQVARVDLACLTIKVALADRVGQKALRRLAGMGAVRVELLGDRLRRHAEAANAAILNADAASERADGTLTGELDTSTDAPPPAPIAGPSAAVFRELHGPQLHGFALLLTLGDQPTASQLAGSALAAGASRAREQENASRAAVWLRQSVLRGARRRGVDQPDDEVSRRAALETLGVDGTAFAALSTLNILERAAVVASNVERLDDSDVATIVGLEEDRSQRLVRDALRRATSAAMPDGSQSDKEGPIVTHVREIAARALA